MRRRNIYCGKQLASEQTYLSHIRDCDKALILNRHKLVFQTLTLNTSMMDMIELVVYCNVPDNVGRDEQNGELKGLTVDVMEKACQMARKTCVTVTSNACWNNEDQSSLGRWRYTNNVNGDCE